MYKISIGIPAFNEGENIRFLLENILLQRQKDFILSEIIVISDGSTDNTATFAQSMSDSRVIVIDHPDRKGQSIRQNEIIERFVGDILILFNADVLPKDEYFLERLVSRFSESRNVGLVQPVSIPLPPRTYFEKIINFSVDLKNSIAGNWNGGKNYLTCHGVARAFSRSFAKTIHWPNTISEDGFSYLSCIQSKYEYVYSLDSVVLYRSPDNLADHLKQSLRFSYGEKVMSHYFDPVFVKKEYRIPLAISVKYLVLYFFKNPILFISYVGTRIIIALYPNKKIFINSLWSISKSSKKLL